MRAGLHRYGNIQPSELDRMTVPEAGATLNDLKYLVGEEEKAKRQAQEDMMNQVHQSRRLI